MLSINRSLVLVLLLLMMMAPEVVRAQEVIVYGGGGVGRGANEFLEYAHQIDVIAPQSYSVDSLGVVSGGVPEKLLREAKETHTFLMPLIMNPGFNQAQIRGLLNNATARARTIDFMVQDGVENGFWGWQFDFENVHLNQKEAFTVFFQEAAAALHEVGMTASVAVVPTNNQAEEKGFSRYMQDNWRGNFDMVALAEAEISFL